jgi:hypothetical protein
MQGVDYVSEGQADRAPGGLGAVDREIQRLSDAINQLGSELVQVSRFDLPEERLAEVRAEPPSTLRAFETRLADLTETVERIRRQLDL